MDANRCEIVYSKPAKKVWRSPLTGKLFWPPLPIVRFINIITCKIGGHVWSRWRRETEEWFEYVDAPLPWAWRICDRCRSTEHVREL